MLEGAFKLDRIDIRILSHLQQSGRIANVDLADAVGPVSYTHLTLPTIYSV